MFALRQTVTSAARPMCSWTIARPRARSLGGSGTWVIARSPSSMARPNMGRPVAGARAIWRLSPSGAGRSGLNGSRPGSFLQPVGFRRGRGAACPLPDRPTAIFAANDEMALGVLAAAVKRGLSVPEDLSVAGFDDGPSASSAWPRLTTVHQPISEMANAATEMLIEGFGDERFRGRTTARQLDYKDRRARLDRVSSRALTFRLRCNRFDPGTVLRQL
jgi:hypothetical protein